MQSRLIILNVYANSSRHRLKTLSVESLLALSKGTLVLEMVFYKTYYFIVQFMLNVVMWTLSDLELDTLFWSAFTFVKAVKEKNKVPRKLTPIATLIDISIFEYNNTIMVLCSIIPESTGVKVLEAICF